jgi:hypothetical protein
VVIRFPVDGHFVDRVKTLEKVNSGGWGESNDDGDDE